MKKIIFVSGMILSLAASANIEYSSQENGKATSQEISRSRSCFHEVEVQGCGTPDGDIKQFRSCLNNIYSSLTDDCKKMMSELYGTK